MVSNLDRVPPNVFVERPVIYKLGGTPTFASPEVFSHQGPLAHLIEACDFHLLLSLPVRQCKMMGLGGLTATQLQLHIPKQRGSIELVSYMWFGMPKESSRVFHDNPS